MTTITLSGPTLRAQQQQTNQIVKSNITATTRFEKIWKDWELENRKRGDDLLLSLDKRSIAFTDFIRDVSPAFSLQNGRFVFPDFGAALDSIIDVAELQARMGLQDAMDFAEGVGRETLGAVVDTVKEVFRPAVEELKEAGREIKEWAENAAQDVSDFIRPQPSTTPTVPRPMPTSPVGMILYNAEEEGEEAINTLRHNTADAVEAFGKDIGTVAAQSGENLAVLPGAMAENFIDGLFDSLFGGGEGREEEEFLSLKDILDQTLAGATDALRQLKDTLSNALKTMVDTVKGILVNTANELLNLVLKPVTDALADAVKGVLDLIIGEDGLLGSILGGLFGRAGGGRVQPGLPVLVGERGPELLVPSRAGTVMNGADTRMALAGGPGGIVINNTFTVDVRDSVRAEIQNTMPIMQESVFDALARAERGKR